MTRTKFLVSTVFGVLALGCSAVDPAPDAAEGPSEELADDLSVRACKADGDCPVPAVCRECPDGVSFSCAEGVCTNGRCGVRFPPCPGLVQCGGIAGIPCPSGFECVDDPRDDCSPCRGGADCGGICVELSCKPVCDPGLICAQVLTCVDGQLYPTACGPRNCDKPLGPCSETR
jgi:hypothetical protein